MCVCCLLVYLSTKTTESLIHIWFPSPAGPAAHIFPRLPPELTRWAHSSFGQSGSEGDAMKEILEVLAST